TALTTNSEPKRVPSELKTWPRMDSPEASPPVWLSSVHDTTKRPPASPVTAGEVSWVTVGVTRNPKTGFPAAGVEKLGRPVAAGRSVFQCGDKSAVGQGREVRAILLPGDLGVRQELRAELRRVGAEDLRMDRILRIARTADLVGPRHREAAAGEGRDGGL